MSGNSIMKEECKVIVSKLIRGLEQEIEMREAIEDADILEEELKGGIIKPFNLIFSPQIASEIWERIKNEDTCTPIIMSE